MKFINDILPEDKQKKIDFSFFEPFPNIKRITEPHTRWTVCYESDIYIISVQKFGRDSLEYFGGAWGGRKFRFSATSYLNSNRDFLWTVYLDDIYLSSMQNELILQEELRDFRHEIAPYICEALKVFGIQYGSKGCNSVQALVKGARLQ